MREPDAFGSTTILAARLSRHFSDFSRIFSPIVNPRGISWRIHRVGSLLASLTFLFLPGCGDDRRPQRPNIVIILADDLGFSDIGSYGGEIQTPNLDRLAANGLRFTQFYNTARCWPTRSALLTGYYPQQIRMDPPEGRLPRWANILPRHLRPLGYRSYHAGKWHIFGAPNPVADGGFDHSYKLDDQDRYFSPQQHFEDDAHLPPVQPGSGYYATTAITDYAVRWLKSHAGQHSADPFFLYVAFTAPHFPLHALPDDIAHYRDRYTQGWDSVREQRWARMRAIGLVPGSLSPRDSQLTPRYWKDDLPAQVGPGEVQHALAWQDLTAEEKTFQATKMAIHAAMIDRMDREIGRILDQLRDMGAMDNTAIFFLSDNGADATLMVRGDGHDRAAPPGSASSYLGLGPGWATVSNTPFRRHKIWVHEGGIATPLIVHWPRGIEARGQLRTQVGHVIDFVPTVLELARSATPSAYGGQAGPPLPGRSLVPILARDTSLDREFLFFQHEGNRALRMGSWKLVSAAEDGSRWELYNLEADRSETVDLALQDPERVRRMQARWEELEAEFRRQAAAPDVTPPSASTGHVR